MKVGYLFPGPRPPRPELDATVRGMMRLAERHPGGVEFLYPGRRYLPLLSRSLAGSTRRAALRRLDREVDVHLLISDRLRPYPFLRALTRPLAYSLTTGLAGARRPLVAPRFGVPWRLVVTSEEDRRVAAGWGLDGAAVIPAGLDLERFSRSDPPAGDEFVLLAGSAPWTRRQFRTKGVEHLLRAAAAIPRLRLVFLWRGAHEREMLDLVGRHGLAARVEVLNRRVDVDRVLARVHAAVVLARSAKLVKAYPDSLLEALAAGRPVIVSRVLPMASFVVEQHCGEVVDRLDAESVTAAVRRLMDRYEQDREGALAAPLERFSLDNFIAAYGELFARLAASRAG